jgi:predicted glycoside hydrolase/deacetylase ChbG (UPF0249 family)
MSARQQLLPPGIIVNADDLGIHPSINAGILSAYRKGILTSCTMLMTTDYRDETVRNYVHPAALPIGIHLSLTLGKALAPAGEVPNLVDEEGYLKLSAGRLLLASFAGTAGANLLAQIERELEAQLACANDCGLRPTHADSHQHVHMNPAIFQIVEKLLSRFGISRLRFSREPFRWTALGADFPSVMSRLNPAKWALLRWRAASIRPNLAVNDEFLGVLHSGLVSKGALHRLIAGVSATKVIEICIHPGFPAPKGQPFYSRQAYNDFISSPARQIEHDILLDADLANLLEGRGLVLRGYDGRAKSL